MNAKACSGASLGSPTYKKNWALVKSDWIVCISPLCIVDVSIIWMKKWTIIVQVNKNYVDEFRVDDSDSTNLNERAKYSVINENVAEESYAWNEGTGKE